MKKSFFRFAVILVSLSLFVSCVACGYTVNEEEERLPTLQRKSYRTESGVINYLLYAPEDVENAPLIIYLHGGSGKGSNLSLLTENDGFPRYLQQGCFGLPNAYIAIPQLTSNHAGWSEIANALIGMIHSLTENYSIDPQKVSLTGHSMGGTGVWSVAAAYPASFSRIVPMSGSIQNTERNQRALSAMPIWAFVGDEDTIVSPSATITFINTIGNINTQAKVTIIEGADHFAVPQAYLSDEYRILQYLMSE